MGTSGRKLFRSLFAIAIAAMTIVCIVPGAHAADAPTITVLHENFENPNFNCDTGWDQDGKEMWVRGDDNDASGDDTWCHSQHRIAPSGGSWSAWCAVIGSNSIAVDRGLPTQSNTASYHYDANMTSYIRHSLNMRSDLGAGTLTFSYWSMTVASSAPGGYDHLRVSVSSDNSSYTTIWTQPSANHGSWEQVTVNNVPSSAKTISFDFISGPYSGNWQEGAYIDNIQVTQVSDASWSHVTSLPAYSPGWFEIDVSVSSAQGAAESVSLYYRTGGSGTYSLYTDQVHENGKFPAGEPIWFNASLTGGELDYQFYSIAYGNEAIEVPPSAPDASTSVDLTAPQATAAANRTAGQNGWYDGPVGVHLSATDQRSGVGSIRYKVDNGTWATFASDLVVTGEGAHDVAYYAVDKAGNTGTEKTLAVNIDSLAPVVVYSYDGSGNLTLLTTDQASGINSSYLRFHNDGEWRMFDARTDIGNIGHDTIDFYATDKAGNIGDIRTLDLDHIPLSAVVLKLDDIGSSSPSGETVRMNWTCEDPSSMVDHFEVLVDGTVVKVLPSTATSFDLVDLTEGERSITLRAVDSGGNSTYRSAVLTVGDPDKSSEITGILLPAIIGVGAVGAVIGALFLRPKRAK